jgi:hypothetical protein
MGPQRRGSSNDGIDDAIFNNESIRTSVDIYLGLESAQMQQSRSSFTSFQSQGPICRIFDAINGYCLKSFMMRECPHRLLDVDRRAAVHIEQE